MQCWRCQNREEISPLGLCRDCRDWFYAEELTPPGPTLIPPGTLPEQIPPYRTPKPSDYQTWLQAPE